MNPRLNEFRNYSYETIRTDCLRRKFSKFPNGLGAGGGDLMLSDTPPDVEYRLVALVK